MNLVIDFIFIALLAGFLWYFRQWLREVMEYKAARRKEIKRRLQMEYKQDQALKIALSDALDDKEKLLLEIKAMNERHQRAINYVIEDVFERNK